MVSSGSSSHRVMRGERAGRAKDAHAMRKIGDNTAMNAFMWLSVARQAE